MQETWKFAKSSFFQPGASVCYQTFALPTLLGRLDFDESIYQAGFGHVHFMSYSDNIKHCIVAQKLFGKSEPK
jgi:hypothetical protein